MQQMSSQEAYKLLLEGIIEKEEDLTKNENRWVKHCIYVGKAAKRIAYQLGEDSDYAEALGYLHDIGRKINHGNHPIEGYRYLLAQGYPEEARICLTHSFIENNIQLTAGIVPEGTKKEFLTNYLSARPANIYDNIIQLCDLFCLETGFTTIENRLLDITYRKGITPHSLNHFQHTMALKEKIEARMHCSLYDLFPEISHKDLENIETHRRELINMIDQSTISNYLRK